MNGDKPLDGVTYIKFNKYTTRGPCNVCGTLGPVGAKHATRVLKSAQKPTRRVKCGGRFTPLVKKNQGVEVKRYRRALKMAGIPFRETMFINANPQAWQFGCEFYEPGQMYVGFTWGL